MNVRSRMEFPQTDLRLEPSIGSIQGSDARWFVAAMYTASYRRLTERLLASLKSSGIPHALFEVPHVHKSISPKGVDDPRYTKANFIASLVRATGKHVLYLDTDTVIRRKPDLIDALVEQRCDFAILNWLSQTSNAAYAPLQSSEPPKGQADLRHFYRFSHAIDLGATDQIVCSGAVQLWGPSPESLALLQAWHSVVCAQPSVPDDQCLDFAFNNRLHGEGSALKTHWLPKSYARYAWWIFDEPVIDHPDFPFSGAGLPEVVDPANGGRKRLYPERATRRVSSTRFPRGTIWDSRTGIYYQIVNKALKPAGKMNEKIWTQHV